MELFCRIKGENLHLVVHFVFQYLCKGTQNDIRNVRATYIWDSLIYMINKTESYQHGGCSDDLGYIVKRNQIFSLFCCLAELKG